MFTCWSLGNRDLALIDILHCTKFCTHVYHTPGRKKHCSMECTWSNAWVLRKWYTEILTAQLWSPVCTDTWHLCIIVRKLPLMMELWHIFLGIGHHCLLWQSQAVHDVTCVYASTLRYSERWGQSNTCICACVCSAQCGCFSVLWKESSLISVEAQEKDFADVSTKCFCHHQG